MSESKRGRPRAFNREEALSKAMGLFWLKGFENTSLAELTTSMGLNPPSLYATFKSKEALFNEALALYEKTEGGGIWEHLDDAPTAREAVFNLLKASALSFSREDKPKGCMIVLSAPQMCGSSPLICETLRARRMTSVEKLCHRFEQAKQNGELSAQTDCLQLATFVVTFQHGMSFQARDGASRASLLMLAEQFLHSWDCLSRV